jgi:hypothetical protein
VDPVPTDAERDARIDAQLDQLIAEMPPLDDEELDALASLVAAIRLRAEL